MSVYAKMKKQLEILNLLIGLELVVVGLVYLVLLDIPSAASWSIFGCMYLVMDKYSVLENMSQRREFVERVKYFSAWLGFAVSTAFLIYVIATL